MDESQLSRYKLANRFFSHPDRNAAKKLNPLDADILRQLLSPLQIVQQQCYPQAIDQVTPSPTRRSRERSPTASYLSLSPTEEDSAHQEALAFDKLVRAGGQPVLLQSELRPIGEMTEELLRRVAYFVDIPKDAPASYIPPLFTCQLHHWKMFQLRWQYCNRGKTVEKKGFAEFLRSMKQDYIDRGAHEWVKDTVSFEGMVQRVWVHDKVGLETSNGRGLKPYTRAGAPRRVSHGFNCNRDSNSSQRFHLLQDPRKQDVWTTLVEYLNFVYWEEDNDRADMEKAEPRYRQAMEELLQLEWEQRPAPLAKSGSTMTLQQQLKAAEKKLTKQWQRIKFISMDSAPYLKLQALVRRHQLRSRWILDELSLAGKEEVKGPSIERHDTRKNAETEKSRKIGPTESDVNTRQLRRKRKARHDEDEKEQDADNKIDEIEAPSRLKRSRTARTRNQAVPKTRRSVHE